MASLPPGYFDELYADDIDPWSFRTSGYEHAKYAATVSSLPRARYDSVLELGCSIGELTALLAPRAGQLVAVDTSATALDAARKRCASLDNVRFVVAHVPDGAWDGSYDLVVLSEVLYYLDAGDLDRLAARLSRMCAAGSDIVMVHWIGDTDYPMTGDDASRRFIDAMGGRAVTSRRTERYRLDVLRVER